MAPSDSVVRICGDGKGTLDEYSADLPGVSGSAHATDEYVAAMTAAAETRKEHRPQGAPYPKALAAPVKAAKKTAPANRRRRQLWLRRVNARAKAGDCNRR